MLTKQTILKKTLQVGGSTIFSRALGLIREVLMANYLGAGPLAEAFITAYKIPNSLRKIFAEGALSVAFIPTFVTIAKKDGKEQINKLMSLALILFEGALLIICLLAIWKADWVIRLVAPGWFSIDKVTLIPATGIQFIDVFTEGFNSIWSVFVDKSVEPTWYVAHAISFLRILMSFILFLSTSALIAGVLQSMHHFFVPAFSPVLLNIVYIFGLFVCVTFKLSPIYLCLFIIGGGIIQLILHIIVYVKLGFGLGKIDYKTWQYFKDVWRKFLPCLFSMSVMEIYLFIDTSFGSYLPGAIAHLYYANRFMQIPLGVIATALSTILLPHFSRIGVYAPKRLGFYLLESSKLIFWTMIPISLVMAMVSHKIFFTLFLSEKFTLFDVHQTSIIFIAFLYGLVFFSLNKILLNLFYALHETKIPMYISIIATVSNFIFSYLLMKIWGAYGIAMATTLCGVIQTLLFVFFLQYSFDFILYIKRFFEFLFYCSIQWLVFGSLFLVCYLGIIKLLSKIHLSTFLLTKIGFWLWFLPLASILFLGLYKSRRFFGIHLYFLD
ncbi:MAG: murein biosynthesis integral membrane protein MurJ [Candidatus Babeliales bacterium]